MGRPPGHAPAAAADSRGGQEHIRLIPGRFGAFAVDSRIGSRWRLDLTFR
jgi:hypothetical protein